MKTKRIVSFILVGLLILFSYLYFFNATKIYMGILNPSMYSGIDIMVAINKNEPFRDTLYSGLFNYKVKTVKMRWGKNEIIVTSSKTKTVLKREIFLNPFENIVIVFSPPESSTGQPAYFSLAVIRGDFVYE